MASRRPWNESSAPGSRHDSRGSSPALDGRCAPPGKPPFVCPPTASVSGGTSAAADWSLAGLVGMAVAAVDLVCQGPSQAEAFPTAWRLAGISLGSAAIVRFLSGRPSGSMLSDAETGSLRSGVRSVAVDCGVAVLAAGAEAALRSWLGVPILMDLALLLVLRNTAFLLAIRPQAGPKAPGGSFGHPARSRAAAVSLFLVVFAVASIPGVWSVSLTCLFAAAGTTWLMARHWAAVSDGIVSTTRTALPGRWRIGLPLLPLAGVLALSPLTGWQLRAIEGYMPASGGTRDASAAAREGLGDGDLLVAGLEDIRSFAPIEDAPFAASHEPTLYDVFDDTYQEPVKKTTHERAISLPPLPNQVREDPSRVESRRPGREFSTVRKTPDRSRPRIGGIDSRALVHVRGRVPLHLALERFSRYDGVDWTPQGPAAEPPLTVEMVHGRPWLRVGVQSTSTIHGRTELHAIKIGDLRTNRVPCPNQLTGIHIDQVGEAGFFRRVQPSVVALDRETIPEMLAIHIQSRVVDPQRLEGLAGGFEHGPEECLQFGSDEDSLRVRSLAESWVQGLPRGWPQIARVVERIRARAAFDRDARAEGLQGHSVAEFLFDTRRGPDYLFASAAAWSLRSLGYATRLVGGFHADPRRYDVRTGHTAVLAEDVHVWVEVWSAEGWVTLEPTPGYEVLGPPPSLLDRIRAFARAFLRLAVRHPSAVATVLAMVVGCVLLRVRLADDIDRLIWLTRLHLQARLDPRGWGSRRDVLATISLLERRFQRAGLPRPDHRSPGHWLRTVVAGEPSRCGTRTSDGDGSETPFIAAADRALYSPRTDEPVDRRLLLEAERIWSLRAVRGRRALLRKGPCTAEARRIGGAGRLSDRAASRVTRPSFRIRRAPPVVADAARGRVSPSQFSEEAVA